MDDHKRSIKMVDLRVMAVSLKAAEDLMQEIDGVAGFADTIIRAQITWNYMTSTGLDFSYLTEPLNDITFPEAYPFIPNLEGFISAYADGSENILLLSGPPGTGKSRLIRYIMHQMAERTDSKEVKVSYTTDANCLESDEMYVEFVTHHDLMVLEDIDAHLGKRVEGNFQTMYRLLAVSDGIIQGRSKKIILSTNLESISHIDEAILRPGRCYDCVQTRTLTSEEALSLLTHIAPDREFQVEENLALSQVYKLAATGNIQPNIKETGLKDKRMGLRL
jgi:hypothetical protein